MSRSPVARPTPQPLLVSSTVDGSPDVLARESASHAAAIRRLEARVGAVTDATAVGALPIAVTSAKDFGARGDGVTDDGPAINAALAFAAGKTAGMFGGDVYLPKGTYVTSVPIVLPGGTGLRGDGPSATRLQAARTFNGQSLVRNQDQDGTQEYAFLTGMQIDGNSGSGAICTVAVVDFVSLFINSWIRDVVILGGSNVGLRLAASNGMGPVLVDNTWVLHCGGHNILVEELAGNTNACAGIYLHHVTSENWGANCSAIYLKGIGASGNYRLENIHMEHLGDVTGLTGITFDGVSHVRAVNIQLQSGAPASYTQGIKITSAPQNVDIVLDDVTNINVINPVLVDSTSGATLDGVNVNHYTTPDVTTFGGPRFAPATNNTGAGAPNVAMAITARDGSNIFSASYPGLGGGVLRWVYTTGGTDIMQWGTDGTIFVYQLMTLQNGLRGFATRTAAPSSGTHVQGEIVFNADAIAGGFIGWVCVTGGTPGTWKTWGAITP